jgi:hypothetical protein
MEDLTRRAHDPNTGQLRPNHVKRVLQVSVALAALISTPPLSRLLAGLYYCSSLAAERKPRS